MGLFVIPKNITKGLNILTTYIVDKTSHHNHFFLLLVYLGVVILELYETKNEVLLI